MNTKTRRIFVGLKNKLKKFRALVAALELLFLLWQNNNRIQVAGI